MKYHIKVTKRTNQALKTKMDEICMTVGGSSQLGTQGMSMPLEYPSLTVKTSFHDFCLNS